MTFDLSKPQARAIRSPMGGGWIIPLTPEGRRTLSDFFGEQPAFIPPIQETGWLVEPADAADLAAHLLAKKMAWEVR